MTNVSSGYSSIEIVDYQVSVNLPVTKENGDECVLFWENDKIVTSDWKNRIMVGWKHLVLKKRKLFT